MLKGRGGFGLILWVVGVGGCHGLVFLFIYFVGCHDFDLILFLLPFFFFFFLVLEEDFGFQLIKISLSTEFWR